MLSLADQYAVHFGDCIPHMHRMEHESIDLAVFSPPFPSVYSYTNQACDIGNSEDLKGEAKLHLGFFYRAIRPLIKPGRVMVVHVTQIPRMKRSGEVGLFDFRGLNIKLAERAGFVFEYDWAIRKNPQSQAIRTRSRELQFVGLENDRAKSRGALSDYLLKFRAPGENAVPIRDWEIRQYAGEDGPDKVSIHPQQITRNDWIKWAEPTWADIKETDTLNTRAAKGPDDTRHICPLQLEVIRRLIRLYSNPGELVFSPFTGIGSEGYEALKLNRRFYGCEIKPEYHAQALKNLKAALDHTEQPDLFSDDEFLGDVEIDGETADDMHGRLPDGSLASQQGLF